MLIPPSSHHSHQAMVAELDSMPIAINTQEANQQHYEVPTGMCALTRQAAEKN